MDVIELRQYRLRPGRRDELIELFDGHLVEPQEAAGMTVLGQFRDLDDPGKFVWMRGFADMGARGEALRAFYYGPVWKAHRERANATMLDSSDARLLRPLRPVRPAPRPPAGAPEPDAPVYAFLWSFGDRLAEAERTMLDEVVPLYGPDALALATLEAENDFPALPVRTGGGHVVVIASGEVELPGGVPEPQVLRLAPTGRSRLR
ncbi:NIPSNAP family protein [Actinomadura violacea]|uniref:NIPSNAP family protein n=1 Tax=Actinomadura violacea TaxID=2819934 RepID=A0ABS3RQX4_9ACTN|nr:NIPSNAP family protein [Actinomadura violacea]MBO2458943.1 NIPSNAP family protein [Actinomadura violacea]